MGGANNGGAIAAQGFGAPVDGAASGPNTPVGRNPGQVGVVVVNQRVLFGKQVHDGVGLRFAVVSNTGFIGKAKNQHVRTMQRAALVVEGIDHLIDHVARHGVVDVASQLDEAAVEIQFTGPPCEIPRVDRDAVAADAHARVKRHETKGFGFGGSLHLPDVDAEGRVDGLEFVDQADVDVAEDVFGELDGLCGVAAADGNDGVDGLGVEFAGALQAALGQAADDLGYLAQLTFGIAGIFALGREGEMEFLARHQPGAALENLAKFVAGGARVSAGFQADQHAGTQAGGHLTTGVQNV